MVGTMKKKKERSTSPKYRSKLEARVAELIPNAEYESDKLTYIVPASTHKYLTDFKIAPTVFIEVKGRLMPSERKKYLLVKEQNPDVELRFFFDKANNKLYKGSPTTYGEWADKNGFKWSETKIGIPKDWIKECK